MARYKAKRIRNRRKHEEEFLNTFADIIRALDVDGLDAADKLHLFFSPSERKFYRRRILGAVQVTGLWWVRDNVDSHFKVHKTRKLMHRVTKYGSFWLYVRDDERDDFVDVEAKVYTPTSSEFQTVTISREEYARLDSVLGPCEAVCSKHRKD